MLGRADAQRVVVTGATGFLGGSVSRRLRADSPGMEIVALGRDPRCGAGLQQAGIEFEQVELTDYPAVQHALKGADVVIHCAALSSPWGPLSAFHAANVTASEHIARACVEAGTTRLVHISTPSIYHDGQPHLCVQEDAPLPARAVNHYAATKAEGERRLLAIAAAGGVSAVALRPRAIFGPGDTSLLPRLAHALRSGRLPRIGDGSCTVDMSYVDNVVDAVLLAMKAPADLSGRSYNISNGEPVRIWDVIDQLADAIDVPRPRVRISRRSALVLATWMEGVFGLLAPLREPPLLRYGVDLLSVDMTLDIRRAREELGYQPRVAMAEALQRTFEGLDHHG